MTPGAAFVTGLSAGLFGSVHCAAMCGGIVALLHSQLARQRMAWGFHLGRILSYLTLAAVFALLGALPASLAPGIFVPVMRVALGVLLMVIAVYVAAPGRYRDWLGELVQPVTRRLMPLFGRLLPADRWDKTVALGLLWGLLPCGLLYSMLTAAWLLADPLPALSLMLGFGLGTVPLLLGTGLGAHRLGRPLRRRWLRNAAAVMLFGTGLLIAAGPWLASRVHHRGLDFLLECIGA
ncbi:MAG: sulfite exporter TauE/SafE family protein [Wenzhouxiangellaceae bacterium]